MADPVRFPRLSSNNLNLTTSQVVNDSFDVAAPDVEMEEGGADDVQIIEAATTAAAGAEAANNDGEDVEITEDELPKRVTFLEQAHSGAHQSRRYRV